MMAQRFCVLQRFDESGEQSHVGFYRTPYEAKEAAKRLVEEAGEALGFALFIGDEVETFTVEVQR